MKKSILLALPAVVLLASCGDKKLNTEKTVEELNNTIQNVTSGDVVFIEGSIKALDEDIKFEAAIETKTKKTYEKVTSNGTGSNGDYVLTTTTISNPNEDGTATIYTKDEYVYTNPEFNKVDESWITGETEFEIENLDTLKNSITKENFEKYGLIVDNKSKDACVTSIKKDGTLTITVDCSKVNIEQIITSAVTTDNSYIDMISQFASAITLSGKINVALTNEVIDIKTDAVTITIDASKIDASQAGASMSVQLDASLKISKSSETSYFVIPSENK